MKKIFALLVLLILAACSAKQPVVGTIKIKGSDTMLALTERFAEEFMRLNPGVSIYVSGGGTYQGIKYLTRNEIDVCTASRPLKSEEAKLIADKYGSLGMSFLIAKDALSVYLHPENRVKNLSMEQLKGIFTGKITNWKEVGGNDATINVVVRSSNSGTHSYFRDHVLDGENYKENVIIKQSNNDIAKAILSDKYAIGYGGMSFGKDITHASIDGIKATVANSIDGLYPITRYLQFYTINTPQSTVKQFINFVISNEGQKIVEEKGFIPLWKLSY